MSGKRFPSPSGWLRRVGTAWAVILTVWLSQTGLAWLVAGPTRGAAKAAAGDFGYLEDGHLLFSIIELIVGTPAIAAALIGGLTASAVLGFVMWLVFAGAVLTGVRSDVSVGRAMGRGIEAAPRIAAQALYVTVLRALLFAPSFLPGVAGKVGGVLGTLLVLITIPAFDRVRAAVTRTDVQKPMHPRHLIAAIRASILRPLVSLPVVVLWLASLMYLAGILVFVLSAPQQASTIWIARIGGLVPVLLATLRLALVVEDQAGTEPREAASASGQAKPQAA